MVIKVTEDCTGCNSCESVCPTKSIALQSGKAVISDTCEACGKCIEVCPADAIVREIACPKNDMTKNEYKGVWVFLEATDKKLRKVGLELLGEARKLADMTGQKLSGVLLGYGVADNAKSAIAAGADQVYLVEAPELEQYSTDGYNIVLSDLIQTYKPSVVIIGATDYGRDLAPRVACRIGTGLTSECTDFAMDEATGLVAWTRPSFGGRIVATVLCPERRPQMGTVRPASFNPPTPDYTRKGTVIRVESKVKPEDIRTKLVEVIANYKTPFNLEEAEIIVSGGRGMQSKKNFELIKELADVLGGTVGATRAAVDHGWIPYRHQVGYAGKRVKPKLYIACGISGAMQHNAGMMSSDVIIAINRNHKATMFEFADFSVIGNCMDILPLLTQEFKKLLNKTTDGSPTQDQVDTLPAGANLAEDKSANNTGDDKGN